MSQIPAVSITPTTAIVGGSFLNGTYIRIFYQRSDGTLGAVTSDRSGADGSWSSTPLVSDATKAKKNTPLSLVLFKWNGGQFTSRIFYLGPNNNIRWFGVKGTASDGEVLLKDGSPVYAAPYSKLGSFAWLENNVSHIRIAYQRADNTIAQLNWDGSDDFRFTAAAEVSPPTGQGTALAFVNQAPPNTPQYFRGYYEHSTNQIMELLNEPSQNYTGTMINGQDTIPPNAFIAASVVPVASSPKQGRISVLWQNAQAGITQCIFDGSWQKPQALPGVSLYNGGGFATSSYLREDGDLNTRQERLIWMGQDANLYHKVH